MQNRDIIQHARGRWPDILATLAGLTAEQLSDKHQPCPLCGGKDRYRFDDKDGTGSWFCGRCGGRDHQGGGGSGIDLLMRRQGWDFPAAVQRIKQHLGMDPAHSLPTTSPPTTGAESVWHYSPTFLVCRFPGKRIRPLTWDGTAWRWKAPAETRPLLNRAEIIAKPDRAVLIVEGEKTADAAAALFPQLQVTTWSGGCKALAKTDFSLLAGRRCVLWPDNDEPGTSAMAQLACILHTLPAASVKQINAPPGSPEGWDLADATWTPAQADAYAIQNVRVIEPIRLPISEPLTTPTDLEPARKAVKTDAAELLHMLRKSAKTDEIRYNVFTRSVEINGKNWRSPERFYLVLAEQGYIVGKDLAVDCLVQVAEENSYDPVKLYLEHVEASCQLPADIDRLASFYLRPEDQSIDRPTLYDHMLKCTLIGAVRRALEPGCKHDTACVLMGDQGGRKSSFWAILGGPFFSDALGDISDKDDVMKLHRSWIMEWAELDHIMSRKHAGTVKAFLTQSTDVIRVPYGKAMEEFPRRGIIVGSTNRTTGFLVDDTGNRRFWVIPTSRTEQNPIETTELLEQRDAIWAAAVKAYRRGELSYLSHELAIAVTTENQQHQVDAPWRAPIEAWLQAPANAGKVITSELLLSEAIERPIERQTRSDQMQVATILSDLGLTKRRLRIEGILRWVWALPE